MLKGASNSEARLRTRRRRPGHQRRQKKPGSGTGSSSEEKYDENNRLIEYNKLRLQYDKGNNPTKIEGEARYTYNEADQLKKRPTAKYKYNEDGERTTLEPKSGEPTTTYGYDQAGHLTSTKRAKGPKQTEINEAITFDGNGLSQEATFNGTKEKAAWDTAEPLPITLEYETGAGEEEVAFIYGPENLPVEEAFGLNAIYLHHDQQGSTRLVTYWEEGNVVGWKTYGPYGNTIETAGDATPLGYDAQPNDPETGLISLGAREYDPNTAQFMSTDPLMENTGEAYSYGRDNPENNSDPTGQCAVGGKSLGQCLWLGAEILYSAAVLKLGLHTGEIKSTVEFRNKIVEFRKECSFKNMKTEAQAVRWAVEEKLKNLRQAVLRTISELERAGPAQKAAAAVELTALTGLVVGLSLVAA